MRLICLFHFSPIFVAHCSLVFDFSLHDVCGSLVFFFWLFVSLHSRLIFVAFLFILFNVIFVAHYYSIPFWPDICGLLFDFSLIFVTHCLIWALCLWLSCLHMHVFDSRLIFVAYSLIFNWYLRLTVWLLIGLTFEAHCII